MAERTPDTPADLMLESLGKEIMKVFRVYDGSSRLITQYEAFANTLDGQPCIKTEYTYDGVTTNILKMKESQGTWLTAYDI